MGILLLVSSIACIPVLHSPDGGADDTYVWTAPENGWPMSTPPDDLQPEGFSEGQVIPDFLLPDQNGQQVSLWQFYGDVVVVDVSTSWCSPCQHLAGGVQTMADDYADQGFVYLTLLSQNLEHEAPAQDDLVAWADHFEIDQPVVGDSTTWYTGIVPNEEYPGVLLIDRDMTVVGPIDGVGGDNGDELIRDAVEEIL